MKNLNKILMIMIVLLFSEVVSAQVNVNINVGQSSPRYYYLQDIQCYYDIDASMYIYLSGSRWIHARVLPASYGRYNFRKGHKVIIRDYRGDEPYVYYREHKAKFPKGQGRSTGQRSWSSKNNQSQDKQNIKSDQNFKGDNKKNYNGNNSNGGNKSKGGNKGNSGGQGKGKRK